MQPADGNPGALGMLRTGRGAAVGAEERIGAAARGRALLRASDSDRERVLDILKTAFVQGRLSKEELDLRVAQTLGSRTWGDLSAVTADIPAWPLPQPVRKPVSTSSSQPMHAAIRAVACAVIALAAITIMGMPGLWRMAAPPSATAQACQIFFAWQNTSTPNVAMLNVAAETASNGSHPLLATHLATLQAAWLRDQNVGGEPQSLAVRQAETSQIHADISQVAQDCQNDGY